MASAWAWDDAAATITTSAPDGRSVPAPHRQCPPETVWRRARRSPPPRTVDRGQATADRRPGCRSVRNTRAAPMHAGQPDLKAADLPGPDDHQSSPGPTRASLCPLRTGPAAWPPTPRRRDPGRDVMQAPDQQHGGRNDHVLREAAVEVISHGQLVRADRLPVGRQSVHCPHGMAATTWALSPMHRPATADPTATTSPGDLVPHHPRRDHPVAAVPPDLHIGPTGRTGAHPQQ